MSDEKQENQQPSQKTIEDEVEAQTTAATEEILDEEPLELNVEYMEGNAANGNITIESLLQQIEELHNEKQDLNDKLVRVMADMENLRRRKDREIEDKGKYAVSKFANDILSIADNIHRAIESVPAEAIEEDEALKSLIEGVQMTDREFLNVVERHGISRLDPVDQPFDPNMHQAMFEVEDKEKPSGTIVQVMQAGYMIGERTLRPAMVGVSKGGPKIPKPEVIDSEETEEASKSTDEAPEAKKEATADKEPEKGAKSDSQKEDNESAEATSAKDDGVGQKVDKSA